MHIYFYGACETVTGSCFLLETAGFRLLVDCGLFQGSKVVKELNYGPFPFEPQTVDAVILTHAHIDHSGLIPKLVKHGYCGPVYATPETLELCSVLFPDSGYIQEMEVERKNRKLKRANKPLLQPIYTAEDGFAALKSLIPVNYNQNIQLGSNITAKFIDAGHILGSAHVVLQVAEGADSKTVVFSGDIGSDDQPFVKNPSEISQADIILMETTYGHKSHVDKAKRADILADIINSAQTKGGNIIIPAFAVERTQDILFYLNKLQMEKRIPIMPIYIDSPLAVAATRIFAKYTENFDAESTDLLQRGYNPFAMENLHFSETTEDSLALNNLDRASIIISASGMADAGRIKHHLKHNLWRPEATVVFVGYQAEGSLGRRLLEGAKEVTIHGEKISVNADIVRLPGFSAHADQEELFNWVKNAGQTAANIILVHGEGEALLEFAQLLRQKLGKEAIIPVLGESIEFLKEAVIRHKPAVSWLKEIAERLNSADTDMTVRKKNTGKKPNAAEVNAAYEKMRYNLKTIINNAKSEKDYAYLLETFERINRILDESVYIS